MVAFVKWAAGVITLLCQMSSVSADDCPTAASGKLGFVLEKQGVVTEVGKSADGLTYVINRYGSGKEQRIVSFRGLFDIFSTSSDRQTLSLPLLDVRKLFPLSPGTKRSFSALDGSFEQPGTPVSIQMTVGRKETVDIGACQYSVLPIRNRILADDGSILDEWTGLYSVDLGFTLAKRYEDAGGPVTVQYDSIRPLQTAKR